VNFVTGTLKIISKQPEAICCKGRVRGAESEFCKGRVRGAESDFSVSDVAAYMSVSLSEDKHRFLFYVHIFTSHKLVYTIY